MHLLVALGAENVNTSGRRETVARQIEADAHAIVLISPNDVMLRHPWSTSVSVTDAYPSDWRLSRSEIAATTRDLQDRLHRTGDFDHLSPSEFRATTHHLLNGVSSRLASSRVAAARIADLVSDSGAPVRVLIPRNPLRIFSDPSDLWLLLFVAQYPRFSALEFGDYGRDAWVSHGSVTRVQLISGLDQRSGHQPPPKAHGRGKNRKLLLPAGIANDLVLYKVLHGSLTVETTYEPEYAGVVPDVRLAYPPRITPSWTVDLNAFACSARDPAEQANRLIDEAVHRLLRPELMAVQQEARRLIQTTEPRALIMSDILFHDTALVAVEARRQGVPISVLPHASAPVGLEGWRNLPPDTATASWRSGALQWRRIGVRRVSTNSQVKGLEPARNPMIRTRSRVATILYVGTARADFDYPCAARQVFSGNQAALLTVPSDLRGSVRILVKPRPVWEDASGYVDFCRDDSDIELESGSMTDALAQADIAVCHDILTTGLYEAMLRRIPCFFVSGDDVIDQYVLENRHALPPISADCFWRQIRAYVHGTNDLADVVARQHHWMKCETAFERLPIPGMTGSEHASLTARRLRRRGRQIIQLQAARIRSLFARQPGKDNAPMSGPL